MAFINYRKIKQLVDTTGYEATSIALRESLDKKELRADDFSIRDLAEAFMGREWVDNLRPKSGRYVSPAELREAAGDAVTFYQFSNITGQLFFTMVKEAYETEDMVFSKIVPTKSSKIQGMERIPAISEVGDEFTVLAETDLYPNFGVNEDFQDVAAKQKRGGIVPVTKEAIFGDLTGQLQARCQTVGKYLAINKEKRIIDAFVDENAGAVSAVLGGHRYFWKGTSYATHQTSTPWVNAKTSNALLDWTNVEAAWLMGNAILDPYTSEPIPFRPKQIVVTQQLYMTAWRVLQATNVQLHVGGYPVTGNVYDTHSPSPLGQMGPGLQIVTSQLLATRTTTDTDWWLGDIGGVVNYFENWGITPEEAPPQSQEAFGRDIVAQFKASEKGVAAVIDPRKVVESRA